MKDEITKKLLITKLKGNEDIVSIIINKLNENEKNNFDEQYLANTIINFGKYKGRKLYDFKNLRVRPTQAKVRKSIFQILEPFDNLKVLDVFPIM